MSLKGLFAVVGLTVVAGVAGIFFLEELCTKSVSPNIQHVSSKYTDESEDTDRNLDTERVKFQIGHPDEYTDDGPLSMLPVEDVGDQDQTDNQDIQDIQENADDFVAAPENLRKRKLDEMDHEDIL